MRLPCEAHGTPADGNRQGFPFGLATLKNTSSPVFSRNLLVGQAPVLFGTGRPLGQRLSRVLYSV